MIKNIFLPETYGNYYLFGTSFVGVEITGSEVHAVQVKAQGIKRTIEKNVTVPIIGEQNAEWQAKAAQALQTALTGFDLKDHIVTTVPSSQVIIKRMRVPFTDPDKIAQIIGFEVEPLLPFPLNEALVDCIITQTLTAEKSSELFIVAVQKERIEKIKAIFAQANIPITGISVDIISLYNLAYRTIPASTTTTTVFATTGAQTTGLACLTGNQITLIRSMPKGTLSIAKQISAKKNNAPEVALEELVRFGVSSLEHPQEKAEIQTAVNPYLNDIKFTLDAFATELHTSLSSIVMTGSVTDIPGFNDYATAQLGIPCKPFDVTAITQDSSVHFAKSVTIHPHQFIALGSALAIPQTATFNLIKSLPSEKALPLFTKQIIAAITLLLLLFGILGTHFFLQRRKLANAAYKSEQEAIKALKEQFSTITGTRIERVIEDAQEAVNKEESTWFAFSSAARASYLKILLELKSKIDADALGFVIEKLTMQEGHLTIKAHVKDYNALKVLEKALRSSPLLANFEPQATTDFEMKITLASPSREDV
jgi:type IV pilus assembly protein PilM